MKTKEFREIQVSSTLLVVIFLCVLVLGVFIFLLGVSVGKKQVQITAANQVVAQQIQEPAKDQTAVKPLDQGPAKSPAGGDRAPQGTDWSANPPAAPSQRPAPKTTTSAAAKPATKPAAPAGGSGTFYVQVAAFTDRAQAAAEAEKFRKRGFPTVVAEPRATDTKTWFRVRVGGFPTRERAAEALTKLNEAAKKKTDYRIVKD
ncbi:MAG TPA: SPOR domain-containing protein [Terriglobales bacterium]|nr:SPOR domain-containing protein [Terriglobales bacterium]